MNEKKIIPFPSKKYHGNPGKRTAPKPLNLQPLSERPPRELPAGMARKEWKRIVSKLVDFGLATQLDYQAIKDYCICVARLAECEDDISKRGLLVEGQRGKVKNPSVQLAKEYRASLQKWAEKFGLTPLSRSRLSVTEPQVDDPFEKYLNRKKRHA